MLQWNCRGDSETYNFPHVPASLGLCWFGLFGTVSHFWDMYERTIATMCTLLEGLTTDVKRLSIFDMPPQSGSTRVSTLIESYTRQSHLYVY